jgi:hypothetical protein
MVAAFLPLGFNAQAAGNKALQLNGTSQYATVGNAHTAPPVALHARGLVQSRNGGGDPADTGAADLRLDPVDRQGSRDWMKSESNNINYFFGVGRRPAGPLAPTSRSDPTVPARPASTTR